MRGVDVKHSLLEYLVCPDCHIALECHVETKNQDEIETGVLRCPKCEGEYPILRGVPRFVTSERPLHGKNAETADAFGWEWQEFKVLHDLVTYEAQFLDWVHPIQPDFLAGKVVLDAGCGMGRFSLVSSKLGASLVLAVDAGDAVEAARENTCGFSNIHVIQADIHRLPLRFGRDAQVDFAFSIGVLHHLDSPQAGFEALVGHLKRDGTIFVWVYGREGNAWLVNVIDPVRIFLTSRLPRRVLYAISWFITVVLHPVVRLIYRPLRAAGRDNWLYRLLPYNDYLAWLGQFGFRHNHTVVFDHLVAPVAFYIRREEFEAWFQEAGMEIINLSWRNRNSWRGHGGFASDLSGSESPESVG